jgi:hypothetical protein
MSWTLDFYGFKEIKEGKLSPLISNISLIYGSK